MGRMPNIILLSYSFRQKKQQQLSSKTISIFIFPFKTLKCRFELQKPTAIVKLICSRKQRSKLATYCCLKRRHQCLKHVLHSRRAKEANTRLCLPRGLPNDFQKSNTTCFDENFTVLMQQGITNHISPPPLHRHHSLVWFY